LPFSIAVINYFKSRERLKITCGYVYGALARAILSPPFGRPGSQTTTKTGNQNMRMISEKAVAFLLAIAVSGTAFNTFIV
jgi:hypothetical protein